MPALILFLLVFFTELWLMIKVGAQIGAFTTVVAVIGTAVIGIAILRWQGMSTLWRAQQRLDAGELPAEEVVEGLLMALAGIFLLVPGFATDALGGVLLIAPLRRLWVRRLLARGRVGNVVIHRRRPGDAGVTIEGDYQREDRR